MEEESSKVGVFGGKGRVCVCVCYHIGGNYLNLSILNFELDIKELDIKDH